MENSKGKILVVDDVMDILFIVKRQLIELPYDVYTSNSPVEALKMLDSIEIDLVITDYRMPEMDGIQLISEAKKLNPELQFIMITAYSRLEFAIEAMKLGTINYLVKPVRRELLVNAVENGMEKVIMRKSILAAEKRIKDSNKKYRAIVEDQTEFICRFLFCGKLTFKNHAFKRYFEKHEDHFNYYNIHLPQEKEFLQQNFLSLSPKNPSFTREHHTISSKNLTRWHQWTYRALFDDNDNFFEIQAVGRDITNQKRMEDEVKKATADSAFQSGISEMSISIMHNIGNAINSISNRSNLMYKNSLLIKDIVDLLDSTKIKAINELKPFFENDELKNARKLIDMTQEAINALNELMNERLLKYSSEVINGVDHIAEIIRIQQAQVMGKKMLINLELKELLNNCIQMNLTLFEKHLIDIKLNVDENVEIVKWPNNHMVQVINNILTNSLESIISRKKNEQLEGKINIKAEKIKNQKVKISFSDNGCGFDNNQAKKIFQYGFSTKSHGTGLGLHWTANFLYSAGGNIKAFSNGINQGANIVIELPLQIES